MIMILIITKSTEEVKIMLIVHWSYEDGASGTYQGSLGLKKACALDLLGKSCLLGSAGILRKELDTWRGLS